MISNEAVRRLALSLPEATEQAHWGNPSFRVRNKIFATLRPDEDRAVLKLPLPDQDAVVRGRPDIFALAPWEHQGWTFVQLAQIDADEFERLMVIAWQNVAPKRLVAGYEAQQDQTD